MWRRTSSSGVNSFSIEVVAIKMYTITIALRIGKITSLRTWTGPSMYQTSRDQWVHELPTIASHREFTAGYI